MPYLIVVYGPPLAGKTSLAREIAASFDEKAAIVSPDAMLQETIRVHDRDAYAEIEMVHTQARLLVANYLKNRYHVVLEGCFQHEVDGALHAREPEIDLTLGLMRNIALPPLLVRLGATPETLRQRAEATDQRWDPDVAQRIDAAYKQRYGSRSMTLNSDASSPAELAEVVLKRLRTEEN